MLHFFILYIFIPGIPFCSVKKRWSLWRKQKIKVHCSINAKFTKNLQSPNTLGDYKRTSSCSKACFLTTNEFSNDDLCVLSGMAKTITEVAKEKVLLQITSSNVHSHLELSPILISSSHCCLCLFDLHSYLLRVLRTFSSI